VGGGNRFHRLRLFHPIAGGSPSPYLPTYPLVTVTCSYHGVTNQRPTPFRSPTFTLWWCGGKGLACVGDG